MVNDNQFEAYDPHPDDPEFGAAGKNKPELTEAQAISLADRPLLCDYMPGGPLGRKQRRMSSCGEVATHFVFTKTNNLNEPSLHNLPVMRNHGTYFTCAQHAEEGVHDINVDELNKHAEKNLSYGVPQLMATVPTVGEAHPIDEVPRSAGKLFQKSYGENLMKYMSKSFKTKEPDAYESGRGLGFDRAENETPIQHFGRLRATKAKVTQAANQLRSVRQSRRAKGIETELKKPGRPYDVNESNEVEARTYNIRKTDQGLIRLQLALNEGRIPSGGEGDRVTPTLKGVHDSDTYPSTGIAPINDKSTVHPITTVPGAGLGKYAGEDYEAEGVRDIPKMFDDEGNLVNFLAKQGFDSEGNIINTSSKYGHVSLFKKRNTSPDSITVKVHPTRYGAEGGAIAWHEGRAVHVHQISHTENLDKLILKHGIENLGNLPQEAFGRIKTIAVGSKNNPAQQDILDENGEYSHSEPTTSMSKYFWVPSTREATHPDGRPLTKADVTKATTVSSRQQLSNRRSMPDLQSNLDEAQKAITTRGSEFTEGTAGK